MDVVANNLANVDTVGFKREFALFQARYAEAIDQGQAAAGTGTINDIGGGVKVQETHTDFSPGPIQNTKIPSDLALRGEGFFEVKRGEETLLTRAGNFRLNSRGELTTQQGYPVIDENSNPVVLPRPDQPWEVTPAGEIRQGGESQRLAIVKPKSLGDLVKTGENMFRALAPTEKVAATDREVASGVLEMSGAQPTTEMVEMIETSRALEANVNMMKTQDEMQNGLFNRLLKG
jgi:flagellar basal body rod protein FlgG